MKRIFSLLLTAILLLGVIAMPVFAADNSRSYEFKLTVDDKVQTKAAPDQIVTANLVLKRTDSNAKATMYAMQAEMEYDDTFLELIDSTVITAPGVEWTDMGRRTGGRAFYLNFLSLSGGEMWEPELVIGVFQFKVLGDSGVSTVAAKNCLVSTGDGLDSFASICNDVKIIVSTECTVTFEENGGSEVPDQTVQYGEKIKEPKEPTRKGYVFNGWYSDLDRTQLWDFKNDTVQGNMTLYAGWVEGSAHSINFGNGNFFGMMSWRLMLLALLLLILLILLVALVLGKKKVTFDSRGGTRLEPVYVKKGKMVEMPMCPVKPGALFMGWFRDPSCTRPWNFEIDKVEKSMTLYARWN